MNDDDILDNVLMSKGVWGRVYEYLKENKLIDPHTDIAKEEKYRKGLSSSDFEMICILVEKARRNDQSPYTKTGLAKDLDESNYVSVRRTLTNILATYAFHYKLLHVEVAWVNKTQHHYIKSTPLLQKLFAEYYIPTQAAIPEMTKNPTGDNYESKNTTVFNFDTNASRNERSEDIPASSPS